MPTRWETCEEKILSHLRYDPEQGKLFWAKPGLAIKVGKEAGYISNSDWYRRVKICGKLIPTHSIIWFIHNKEWPNGEIDHINRDHLDNRIENLRVATRQQNSANRKMGQGNYHSFKGMSFE